MNSTLIELHNFQKIFYSEEIETHALNGINLTVNVGEYVAISGPSGCGKSTLLALLGLLDVASGGSYKLAGQDVSNLSKNHRAKIRNEQIGFIFQSFNLISDLSVEENIELPLTYRANLKKTERKSLVKNALDQVGMAHRARHYPAQLSGGQQQRVAIARALAGKPSIILADEPTGNLDSQNAEAVMQLLDGVHAQGTTICIVTHDARQAARAKRGIEIIDGRIIADKKALATRLMETIA